MQDGLFVVGPMTGPELREAITGPATAAGLTIDANLADIILADLHTAGQEETEGVLPLLSQAMMLTWSKREGSRLTVRGYNETGGVARSVEYGAEAVYAALPDAGQHIAKEIFQALVLVSPDGQLARRAVTRAALVPARRDGDRRAVDTVLEAFAASRLLVMDRDGPDRPRRLAPGLAEAAWLARKRPGQLDPVRAAAGGRRQVGRARTRPVLPVPGERARRRPAGRGPVGGRFGPPSGPDRRRVRLPGGQPPERGPRRPGTPGGGARPGRAARHRGGRRRGRHAGRPERQPAAHRGGVQPARRAERGARRDRPGSSRVAGRGGLEDRPYPRGPGPACSTS